MVLSVLLGAFFLVVNHSSGGSRPERIRPASCLPEGSIMFIFFSNFLSVLSSSMSSEFFQYLYFMFFFLWLLGFIRHFVH